MADSNSRADIVLTRLARFNATVQGLTWEILHYIKGPPPPVRHP